MIPVSGIDVIPFFKTTDLFCVEPYVEQICISFDNSSIFSLISWKIEFNNDVIDVPDITSPFLYDSDSSFFSTTSNVSPNFILIFINGVESDLIFPTLKFTSPVSLIVYDIPFLIDNPFLPIANCEKFISSIFWSETTTSFISKEEFILNILLILSNVLFSKTTSSSFILYIGV